MTFKDVISESITKNRNVEISYQNYNENNSIRQISNIQYSNEFQKNNNNNYQYISAYCHLRKEIRTFKLNRIEKIRFVENAYNNIWVTNPFFGSTKRSNSSGCYIATMAYGSYDHPQVMILRKFRDDILLNYFIGKLFVKFYYFTSPKIVFILRNQILLNRVIRKILDKFIEKII
jgi:hypothetical protein